MQVDFDILFGFAALLIGSLVILDLYAVVSWIIHKRKGSKAIKVSLDDAPTSSKASTSNILTKVSDVIWKFRLPIMHVVFIGVAVYVLYLGFSPIPNIQTSYPLPDTNWNDYNIPITILFNEPVQISKLRPFLSVEGLQGEWKYEKYLGFLPVTRVAKFYPANTLLPNQRVVVYMTGVSRLGVNEDNEHALNFFSQKEPEVDYTLPANDATEVDISMPLTFKLTSDNQPYDKWDFEIDPKIDFSVETPNSSTFVVKPQKALAQSQTYTVTVYRTAITYDTATKQELSRDNRLLVHTLKFSTRKAPLVKRFTPTGTGVRENSVIEVVFDLPMQQDIVEAKWQMSPPVEGAFKWTDDHTLVFTPAAALPKETEYTITLPTGLKSLTGGMTEAPVSYTFTTIGAVRVSSISPENGAVRVNRSSAVRVTFDQEVDHTSVQSKFGINPTAQGNVTWEGNTLIFTPTTPLNFSTTYSVNIGAGIKSVYGLDSRSEYNYNFTTIPNQTLIAGFNIDLQDYNFTCGVAAAKMMLAWKGIGASEDTLVSIMGEDTSPWAWNGSTHTWGDPNRAFLGYHVDGSGYIPAPGETNSHPAYGALWNPIIKAYNAYGIHTELHRNWDVVSLAHTIEAGHPVQIWWYNGVSGGQTLTWQDNSNGSTIYAIEGMHSVDVIGFNGDPDNPTSFIVMDPWWGYQTYSLAKFNWQWPYLGNTGLIIY